MMMLKPYVDTHSFVVVVAKKELCIWNRGYRVYSADGSSYWCHELGFNDKFREFTRRERQLLTMTDAEASIAAISDGGESYGDKVDQSLSVIKENDDA